MPYQKHEHYLRRCIEISRNARNNGNTPFGAILVDECGKILLEQENIEITEKICTGHAETTLAERRLLELTGNNEQNPTFDLPCRKIFAAGQKKIEVIGPVSELEEEAAAIHKGYWN